MFPWFFLVVSGNAAFPSAGAVTKVHTLHILLNYKVLDFISALISAHSWAKLGKEKTKLLTKQTLDLLLKSKPGNQNVGVEAGLAAAANVHSGRSSDNPIFFVRLQHDTGALVRGRCSGMCEYRKHR